MKPLPSVISDSSPLRIIFLMFELLSMTRELPLFTVTVLSFPSVASAANLIMFLFVPVLSPIVILLFTLMLFNVRAAPFFIAKDSLFIMALSLPINVMLEGEVFLSSVTVNVSGIFPII